MLYVLIVLKYIWENFDDFVMNFVKGDDFVGIGFYVLLNWLIELVIFEVCDDYWGGDFVVFELYYVFYGDNMVFIIVFV